MNMTTTYYGKRLQDAIDLAIKVHEHDQKQKRKGKDVPYITHPLTVGLILSRAGASEEIVAAGILHDTIEDCEPYGSITEESIAKRFGDEVASLVASVTEQDKTLPWKERKERALEHVAHFSHGSILVKSADVLSNTSELYADFRVDGVATFERFNASGAESLIYTAKLIDALKNAWPESPLYADLEEAASYVATMYTVYRNSRMKSLGTYDMSKLTKDDIPEAAARIAERINSNVRDIRREAGE
jgi:hypothetical protein